MTDNVLLRFLSSGLINVGGDDAKFEKLRETANDLATALQKSPAKTISFALVAFDADTCTTDPVVDEGLQALKKRWPTYVNTFSGVPVAVIRAMLLDALVHAAETDDKVAVAFVTSARNALPFMQVGGERKIWIDVLLEVERKVDVRAEAEWTTPSSITVPAMQYEAPAAISVTMDSATVGKAALLKKIQAAVGPQDKAGTPTDGGNPHWPNSPQPWAFEFAPRLTDALKETIDAVAAKLAVEPIEFAEPLQQLANTVTSHVEAATNAFARATAGLQRRTNLLWWKEALFSPTARVSYRDLPVPTAAALMAFDLYQQIPMYSPASVAAFLRETVFTLPGIDGRHERPLRELVDELCASDALSSLKKAAAELTGPPTGRGPLLALMGHEHSCASLDDAGFRNLTGIPATTTLSVPSLAVWIFREFQALRASNDVPSGRRRAQKG